MRSDILFGEIDHILLNTTILIIIGYSFPFFNRDIDRGILNRMKNLNKIYVQVPEKDHNAIKERLESLRSDLPEIAFIKDIELFYIPFEYDG